MRDSDLICGTPQAWILAAVMLLLVPLPWVSGWFFAALLHEASHCLAIYLCGEHIHRIQIGCRGAKITTGTLSDGKAIFCALAGPASGFLLLFLAKQFPRLAVCGFFLSLFNMLPIYPLDGGRALHCFLDILCRHRKQIKIPCK